MPAVHFCVLTAALSFLGALHLPGVSPAQPNIVLFVIDDLGWNDTGYHGAEYSTPTIDKLASEGIRLKQYYVQPVCSPSRSALMAGRYSYNLGLAAGVITNGHPYGLGLSEVTIVQHLKDGGYATHAIGKWDLGMHKWEYTPTYRGFDSFYGYYNAAEDYNTHMCGARYRDPQHPARFIRANGVDFRKNKDPVTNQNGSYSTLLFTNEIQSIISSHDVESGPLFIYAAYQSVHSPLEVPDQYLDKCSSISEPNRKIFCGMMQALDEGVGSIIASLESKGVLENTIIIFTTDNGGQTAEGSSNWPLRGNKATVFEGGIRGFAFVWGKNLPHLNYDNGHLMHITDWYLTILEGIAGLKLSGNVTDLDGFNMWDTITQDKPSPRNEILLQLNPPNYDRPVQKFIGQAAIRVGEWKLIIGQPNCSMVAIDLVEDMCPSGWVYKNGTIEEPPVTPSLTWLFNMTEDPFERNNLADSNPDVVSQLKKRIEFYNATHVEQLGPPFDPAADPKNFGGIWTPWMD